MANFEIKHMREVNGCGTLKATFTVAFGKLELNDCKLIEGRDGMFFSPPSRKYEKDGQTKYANYFYVTDEALKREVEDEAKASFSRIADRRPQGQSRSETGGTCKDCGDTLDSRGYCTNPKCDPIPF